MGFRQATLNDKGQYVGGYARVWSISERNGYVTGNLSTSRKLKDSDRYETDFQDGYVSFFGACADKIKSVDIPDRKGVGIQILSCEVRNKYDEGAKRTYVNYNIYDFKFTDQKSEAPTTKKTPEKKKEEFMNIPDGVDEELPFN